MLPWTLIWSSVALFDTAKATLEAWMPTAWDLLPLCKLLSDSLAASKAPPLAVGSLLW